MAKLKGADGKEFKLEPPQGEELPAKGFAKGEEGFVAAARRGLDRSNFAGPASDYNYAAPFPLGRQGLLRNSRLIKTKARRHDQFLRQGPGSSSAAIWTRSAKQYVSGG